MCEFVSYLVTLDGRVHFLTDADMPRVRKLGISAKDALGHGAIRAVRGWAADNAPQAVEKEYTDFSSPANFPPEIATAIKEGRMTYGPSVLGLLMQAKWDALDAEWQAKWDAVDAERQAKRDALDAVDAEWRAKWVALDAEWRAKLAALDAERQAIFWQAFANPKNRAEAWR